MTPEFLERSLAGDLARAAQILGASLPDEWPDDRQLLEWRLNDLTQDPAYQNWSLRAVILHAEQRVVGHAGFHSRPGAGYLRGIAPGGVELGYSVRPADRRQGYAREICEALMSWADEMHGVRRFVLSIAPSNTASLELARQLGFERVGSRVDPVDGAEDIFVLDR
jgi:RimJ/RimL family protein N-acetyltransferase